MRIWFVDAFAANVFEGNTAAVVPLDAWLPDALMQAIAAENRCAETAFFIPTGLKGNYQLRWFTPLTEVPLCGHATLAAGAVLLTEIAPELDMAVFDTLAGPLVSRKTADGYTLDLPRKARTSWDAPAELAAALGGANFVDAFVGEYANVVLSSEKAVRALTPDHAAIERLVRGPRAGCLAVTAPADEGGAYDFVCRFFAPGVGLPEDPVTGSSFADLAPYWCDRLGKTSVVGYQASRRGGMATALQTLSSVRLLGRVSAYLRGELDPGVLALAPLHGAPANPVAPVAPGRENARPAPAVPDDLRVEVQELDRFDDFEIRVLDWDSPAPEAVEIAAAPVKEPGRFGAAAIAVA
jgi:PhzF family phenazine biosynthesis protein